MRDLIERLERATGPDRELDAMIAARLRIYTGPHEWAAKWNGEFCAINGLVHLLGDHGSRGSFAPPAYTASLDAALTLVPEGCYVDLQTRRRYCSVSSWDDRDYGMPLGTTIGASTPALALCIAALKAREGAK